MTDAAPTGGRRRGTRRWKIIACVLIALPPLGLAVTNLALASPWGRSWIAGKLLVHPTLKAHIRGASWSPWNGVTLRGVSVSQPEELTGCIDEPLVRIESVNAKPVWRAWLRGQPQVRDLELDSPRVVLPIELFTLLAPQPVAIACPPEPAAEEPAPPPAAEGPPTAAVPPPATPEAPAPSTLALPTAWVKMRNASFALVTTTRDTPLLEITGLDAALPIAGAAAKSRIQLRDIRLLGDPALSDLDIPLVWQPPFITSGPIDLESHGLKFTLGGRLAAIHGFPLQIDAALPEQKLTEARLPGSGSTSAESLGAHLRFHGLLRAPASWQGEFVAKGKSITATSDGHTHRFERGGAVVILRGATLTCLDARLISDEFSLLGNGTVFPNGQALGVLRIVAPPDQLPQFSKRLAPDAAPVLTPLSTPQRAALDITAARTPAGLRFQLGPDGPLVSPGSAD